MKQVELSKDLVQNAVAALLKHHKSREKKEELLIDDVQPLQVIFGLEVAPGRKTIKPIRVPIAHGIQNIDDDDCEVCLIVKQSSKTEIEELLAKYPIKFVKQVIGLETLRNQHAQYRQRRQLLKNFDVFLADDRILPMLTQALGKDFIKQKKQPIPVSVTRTTALPFAIEKALKRSTFMTLSQGTCVLIKAGTNRMNVVDIVDNVVAICEFATTKIPRGAANVRSISLKLPNSVSLPIYNKTPEQLDEMAQAAGLSSAWRQEKEEESPKETGDPDANVVDKKEKSPLLRALKKQKKLETDDETKTNSASKKKQDTERSPDMPTEPSTTRKKKQNKTTASEETTKQKDTESEGVKKQHDESKKDTDVSAKKRKKKQNKSTESEDVKQQKENESEESKKQHEPESTKDAAVSAKKKKYKEATKADKSSAKKRKDSSTDEPSPVKKHKDANDKHEKADFIASKKYSGSKEGYVFKKDQLGVGYYVDLKPVVDQMALEALGRLSSGKTKGSGGKRRRR